MKLLLVTKVLHNIFYVLVGRPPGSKSKSRLEAKWAQQIAQGNTNDPTSLPKSNSPSLLPGTITHDTPPFDSSHIDEQISTLFVKHPQTPIKKIKTLKPVVGSNKQASSMVKTPPQQG